MTPDGGVANIVILSVISGANSRWSIPDTWVTVYSGPLRQDSCRRLLVDFGPAGRGSDDAAVHAPESGSSGGRNPAVRRTDSAPRSWQHCGPKTTSEQAEIVDFPNDVSA